jgi:uncharacterized OB-fold protein
MLLIAALETARPGDRILLAAYGAGADAFLFAVTPEITAFQAGGGLKRALECKRYLDSYSLFLSFKNNLVTNPGEPFRTFPSNAGYKRDSKSILNFRGSVCKVCGTAMFPIHRICCKCQAKDQYEEVRLAERKAKLFTYSIDYLAGRGDDPIVVQSVAEDGQGVRYYMLMTDFDKDEVHIGMEVEFTFRKIYEGGNYINYFWKCRPVRPVGGSDERKG